MKKLICMFLLSSVLFSASAQDARTVRQWAKSGQWRNGFTAARPHKTVNLTEFYHQYQKNEAQWQALFHWLATTDLLALPKGKHPIEGTTLVASVEDSENQPLEKRQSESHRRKIDFQYVVRGKEGFALLDHASSTANCKYDEKKDVIHYDFQPDKTNFFDISAKQNRFAIFFPTDWHIAKVQTKGKDQSLRVIVVKMDFVE